MKLNSTKRATIFINEEINEEILINPDLLKNYYQKTMAGTKNLQIECISPIKKISKNYSKQYSKQSTPKNQVNSDNKQNETSNSIKFKCK